jgi:hypothetical protein
MACFSQNLTQTDQKKDAPDPSKGHEAHKPPSDWLANPEKEERVKKGAVQEHNSK